MDIMVATDNFVDRYYCMIENLPKLIVRRNWRIDPGALGKMLTAANKVAAGWMKSCS